MKTNEQENRKEGSFEILERRATGISGLSCEVSKRGLMASCTATCAGREIDEEWARRHVYDEPPLHPAARDYGLPGPGVGASQESKRMNQKLAVVMPEIPVSLVPAALQRGVREKGGKIYHVMIVRLRWYHYAIKIGCSSKKVVVHYDQLQPADFAFTTGSSGCGDGL